MLWLKSKSARQENSPEDPFEELQDECYICLYPCTEESPCKCQTVVHRKCLQDFRDSTNQDACTICLDKYPSTPPKSYIFAKIVFIILSYIVAGVIGQVLYTALSNEPLDIKPFWSVYHIIPAVVVMITAFLGYRFIKWQKIATMS